MVRTGFVLAIAGLACAAAPALGKAAALNGLGQAYSCFEATTAKQALRDSLRHCNGALADADLPAPERVATLINRGIVLMQARKLADAIADFDAAIQLRPESAEAYINKGIALLQMGDRPREAVAQISEGIARGPLKPALAYYQRAMANEDLGRVREAYEDYSRAAALDPEWSDPAEQLQRFRTVRRKTLQG